MASFLKIGILLVLVAVLVAVAAVCRLICPPKEPREIPAVPFWVTLLPLFKDVDQEETFKTYIREPLLKHGAVKIFFGSQWNVLVTRPQLVAEVFKYENAFQKSGNQKKIPGSVLASFLGDNIISSHGDVWRLYQSIMKPGLQEGWGISPIFQNARILKDELLMTVANGGSSPGIPVQEYAQRYTIANLGQVILGVDFGTMHDSKAEISQLQTSIKRQIFQPIFMNFPFLDSLGLPARERAREAAARFTDHIVATVTRANRDPSVEKVPEKSELSQDLLDAWNQGQLTDQQLRDNLTIVFVAGQENPQLALVSTLYLLGKHPEYQDKLHEEFSTLAQADPTADELNSLPQLSACVLESLRLLPPIGQLINRRASKPLNLGGQHFIAEGTYLGYHSAATNRDPEAWGSDADDFVPDRWGSTVETIQKNYRRRRARAEFISFHGGRRACLGERFARLGERFALLQLKVTLYVLIQSLRWTIDPAWPDKMTPAGPLSPRGLKLVFERR